MNAGALSDFVVFEAKTFVTNAAGQQVGTWGTGFSAWAEATRRSETSARFVIWYLSDELGRPLVTPASHRILWDGAIWLITNVVHDPKRSVLFIDSDFSSLIEATHLQSTVREFIEGEPVLRPRSD